MHDDSNSITAFLRDNSDRIYQYGKIIFAHVWGSHCHGTNLINSDMDYLGVIVAPTEKILSLSESVETVDNTGHKPDYQFFEVGKFCRLLLKGNPNLVQTLFVERLCYMNNDWMELQKIRDEFINRQTVSQYLGYASGQLQKIQKGSYLHTTGGQANEKWSYHLIRLLNDAERIANGQPPQVFKSDSERQQLMEIRTGIIPVKDAIEMAQNKFHSLKSFLDSDKCIIKKSANYNLLNNWLINIRKAHWNG